MKYLVKSVGSARPARQIEAVNAREAGRKWAEVHGNPEHGAFVEVTSEETGEVERYNYFARYSISWECDDE